MEEHESLLRSMYEAIEAGCDVSPFFHPEAEQIEYPSVMRPHGHRRPLAEILVGAEQGRRAIASQSYEVRTVLLDGERAAVQLTWQATTAVALGDLAAGTALTAHVGAFYEFKDGLVLRQSSYDCYEPLHG
jgi:predicted ester cyclase